MTKYAEEWNTLSSSTDIEEMAAMLIMSAIEIGFTDVDVEAVTLFHETWGGVEIDLQYLYEKRNQAVAYLNENAIEDSAKDKIRMLYWEAPMESEEDEDVMELTGFIGVYSIEFAKELEEQYGVESGRKGSK